VPHDKGHEENTERAIMRREQGISRQIFTVFDSDAISLYTVYFANVGTRLAWLKSLPCLGLMAF